MKMECNLERMKNNIEKLSEFNSTGGEGTTRFTYSEEYKHAMDFLIGEMENIGLDVKIDPIGNIRARMEGKDKSLPIVMTGSHIDTVAHGGNFDGVAGVITGLEALRVMRENDFQPNNSIELIIFVEEEGPNFNLPLTGSRILTGVFPVDKLKNQINAYGVSMYDAAIKFGLNPKEMESYNLQNGEIKAMIELHIEQSVVLEKLSMPIGIVMAAAGSKWIEIEILGDSNHAGATPMKFRKDAMVGASKIIAEVNNIVSEKANDSTVATVGKIMCYPNVPNVIPGKVVFMLEIRDTIAEGIEIVEKEVKKLIPIICERYDLKYNIREMSKIEPIIFSDKVIETLKKSAENQNIEYMTMNSGALHDACIMAKVTDVGMIFVPSINGRSHCPEELTEFKDIKIGADVLLGALILLSV